MSLAQRPCLFLPALLPTADVNLYEVQLWVHPGLAHGFLVGFLGLLEVATLHTFPFRSSGLEAMAESKLFLPRSGVQLDGLPPVLLDTLKLSSSVHCSP